MVASPNRGDKRPWDYRLTDWLARSARTAANKERPAASMSPRRVAFWVVAYWVLATINNDSFWWWLAAAVTVGSIGAEVRARLIRRSDAGR
jgi:hypothetical protein